MRRTSQKGPRMVLEVSDQERAVAKEVKEDFRKVLDKLDDALKIILDLRDAIVNQRPEKEELNTKYKGRLLRYRNKIRKGFNGFLVDVKSSLEKISKINDPEMVNLREIIVAEMDEMSSGAEGIIDLLGETDRDGFTKSLEQISAQMEKRQKSIIDVIENQLTNHIDNDILGKMKISKMRFKIKRRARIIKQLMR